MKNEYFSISLRIDAYVYGCVCTDTNFVDDFESTTDLNDSRNIRLLTMGLISFWQRQNQSISRFEDRGRKVLKITNQCESKGSDLNN